jgi:CRP-like cAMP-binding protein
MHDAREILGRCALFATLPPDALDRLVPWFAAREVEAGAVVIEEGAAGGELMVVARGSLLVGKAVPGHAEAFVKRIAVGEAAGEVDLVDAERASASVIAEVNSTLLVLETPRLRRMLVSDRRLFAHVARALMVDLAEKVRRTNDRVRDAITWGLDATGEGVS